MLPKWTRATLIEEKQLTKDFKILRFGLPEWCGHVAGQHCDVRIPKEPSVGVRCYSLASSPLEKEIIEFGVEYFKGGAVSPHLFKLTLGDEIEVRGPLGDDFLWTPDLGNLWFSAGGSGVVPFMSMLRHVQANKREGKKPPRLTALLSFSDSEHSLYDEDLRFFSENLTDFKLVRTYTRTRPQSWTGFTGRFDSAIIKDTLLEGKPNVILVCGSTGFVNGISNLLRESGQKTFSTQYFG